MPFADEHHVQRITTALWSRAASGKAAVLVGAGFSANATPLRHNQTSMPGWTMLVHRMIADLYPGDSDAEVQRRKKLGDGAAATSAALRIAQEYEAEFGRDSLNRLISDRVPDTAFGPGELHKSLLQLPWADVLTTNWDTLLERAAELVEERVYRTVRTTADIPMSPAPRIVKLHGSLPSHRPFIFTEEDFRTYPARFAPFVNLARQATMENVLVLVGFSGDDPNFLYWSGWVRDQLGQHAPTIYLVGALDLTGSQRRMLEKRGVQPVDLSQLEAYADWPANRRHAMAAQWFIERLTASRPYRKIRWPKAPPSKGKFALVKPVADPMAPLDLPLAPMQGNWTEEQVRSEILPTFAHNRCLYPGWVTAPQRARDRIWHFLKSAIPEARRALTSLEPELALPLAYEMNWLSEIALAPLFRDLAEPISDLLEKLSPLPASGEAGERVVSLATALMRRARETGDPVAFAKWETWLEVNATAVEARERLQFERCLIARDGLDFTLLDERLSAWEPDGDPFWLVRKAALLAENDRVEEALALSREALAAIRLRTDKDQEDIASWSREAYALRLRSASLASQLQDWERNLAERDTFSDRLLMLAAQGCAADEEVQWFDTEMNHIPPNLPVEEVITRGFDVGNSTTTRHWNTMGAIITRLTALQALRFFEETGTPARIPPNSVAASAIAGAGIWLHTLDTGRAIGALVRSAGGPEKSSMDVVFSRDAVGALSDEEAEIWGQRLLVGSRSLRDRVIDSRTRRSAEPRLVVVLEMLSRLVVRRRSLALPALEVGLSLYGSKEARLSTSKPLQNLLRRAFVALPKSAKAHMRRQFLETDIPTGRGERFDPCDVVFIKAGPLQRDPELASIIAVTTSKVREAQTRWAATLRMQRLRKAGMLSPEEDQAYIDALWDESFIDGGLPGQTPLRPWVFALLPSPRGKDGQQAVRARLLGLSTFTGKDPVGEINGAIAGDSAPLHLSPRELAPLLQLVLAKAATPPEPEESHPIPFFATPEKLDLEFWRLFEEMVSLALKYPSTRKLVRKHFAAPGPVQQAIAAAILVKADEMTQIEAQRLLVAAWDGEDTAIQAAVCGGLSWLRLKPGGAKLPDEIWEVASDAVVARSKNAMSLGLEFMAVAYEQHASDVPPHIDARLQRALKTLLDETGDEEVRAALPYDPGHARRGAARLLRALEAAGRVDPAVMSLWREAAATERMPEIEDRLFCAADDEGGEEV